ncbi:MAG TPA: surface-adhesin E family protein [Coleofasciculaceae cyanobacterium]
MRWILPLAITSVALLSSPALADWVRVKTDLDNDIYSVDVDSIEGRGRLRYFWSNVVFGQPRNTETGQVAHSAVFYLSVDCQNKLYSLRFERVLDENNQSIRDFDYGEYPPQASPASGSSEEASLNFVCSRR